MRWHIFAIGKPKLDFARLGVEEYAARLKPFVPVELHWLKSSGQAGESVPVRAGRGGRHLDENGQSDRCEYRRTDAGPLRESSSHVLGF